MVYVFVLFEGYLYIVNSRKDIQRHNKIKKEVNK